MREAKICLFFFSIQTGSSELIKATMDDKTPDDPSFIRWIEKIFTATESWPATVYSTHDGLCLKTTRLDGSQVNK